MEKINIYEAKTRLSSYLKQLKKGERLVICSRNRPVAELRVLESPRQGPRPIGLAKGQFKVTAAFFKPLPEALLKAFGGKTA